MRKNFEKLHGDKDNMLHRYRTSKRYSLRRQSFAMESFIRIANLRWSSSGVVNLTLAGASGNLWALQQRIS